MKKQFRATIYAAFFLAAAALGQQETGGGGRVLHFGDGAALGRLSIGDANVTCNMQQFHYWVTTKGWERFCPAQGDVRIPAGKHVLLRIDDPHRKDLTRLGQLPPDALYALILVGNYEKPGAIGSGEVEAICRLTGLRELRFSNVKVRDAALGHLKNLASLEILTTPADMADVGLGHVCQVKGLRSLYLSSNRLTDKGLEQIEGLAELEQLTLGGERLSDDCLRFVTRLPKLVHLALIGGFGDGCAVYLKDMQSLKVFYPFRLQNLTDAALPHIAKCGQLEKLGLYNAPVTDAGLVHLTKLTKLKALNLGAWGIREVPITDAGMVHVGKITTLEHLRIDPGVTDRGMGYLSNLKKLRYFWGPTNSNSPLTDRTLESIGKLKSLEELHISGSGFTDAGMEYLAGLANLRTLHLCAAREVTNEGIAELAELKDLKELNLAHSKVTIAGLSRLGGMVNLKTLDVMGIGRDNSVLDISGMRSLEEIRVTMKYIRTAVPRGHGFPTEPLTDEDLACIAKLGGLKLVSFSGGEMLTDKAIENLVNLVNLETVYFTSAKLTDECLSNFSNKKELLDLLISDSSITGRGLECLKGCDALLRVRIGTRADIDQKALNQFRRSMPNVGVCDVYVSREKMQEDEKAGEGAKRRQ